MTTEALIKKVRDELGELNPRDEQVVATVMKMLEKADSTTSQESSTPGFVSPNISIEEFRDLPRTERRRYHAEAEELNRRWIESQMNSLRANWIIVIDGQVVRHGPTLKSFPGDQEIRAISQESGKCPFVFFNKRMLAIEERPTRWHQTDEPNDLYPAVSVTISGQDRHFETEADLDTGAFECYGALELLTGNGVVDVQPDDLEYGSTHLNQEFTYFVKKVWIEMADEVGRSCQCRTGIVCVENWDNSPFTSINPTRTFLLGRTLLLELQPRLVLDFAARRTEVQSVKAAS